jgi:hypothetical protein
MMAIEVIAQEKAAAVRAYLQAEFPGCSIEDWYAPERKIFCFKVSGPGATYHAFVSPEFLDGHEAPGIGPKLARFTLAEHLRDLPSQPVLVTKNGLELEY